VLPRRPHRASRHAGRAAHGATAPPVRPTAHALSCAMPVRQDLCPVCLAYHGRPISRRPGRLCGGRRPEPRVVSAPSEAAASSCQRSPQLPPAHACAPPEQDGTARPVSPTDRFGSRLAVTLLCRSLRVPLHRLSLAVPSVAEPRQHAGPPAAGWGGGPAGPPPRCPGAVHRSCGAGPHKSDAVPLGQWRVLSPLTGHYVRRP
jgi:hypothetical protein